MIREVAKLRCMREAHYSFSVCIMEIRKLLLSLLLQILAERERNFKRLLLVDGMPES
jgi:hypothetical protein